MSKGPEKLKSARHHWWPESLSEFWKDSEGQVYVTQPNGSQRRQPPKGVGVINNGHHIFRDGDWQSSAEPLFSEADTNVTFFIKALRDNEDLFKYVNKNGANYAGFSEEIDNFSQDIFFEFIASLIVRSPQFRSKAKITVESYGSYGNDISHKHHIIPANIAGAYKMASRAIASTGLKFVLFSEGREFFYGDGFLNNVPLTNHYVGGVNCVVPLTPDMAFASFCPIGGYSGGMRFVKLESSQVDQVNFATQLYSANFLFSRSKPLELSEEYRRGEHLQFEYHEFEFLKNLASPFILNLRG